MPNQGRAGEGLAEVIARRAVIAALDSVIPLVQDLIDAAEVGASYWKFQDLRSALYNARHQAEELRTDA